ncbi:hypothetical protein PSA7680_00294 [Pseudoruegeria aquimaris]|uniref:Uncharacterized protein n=1 Tax=Pseudoruegeria aquimaris TaxID=393663 RepID=A0A1Y5RCE6_9RHOB|nr:hypothetical protein [Pseudoruegeria aquimaris]SLN14138.1 hypothetical protein PSA7680_00294 [Pseudoruegeria aquimaris]
MLDSSNLKVCPKCNQGFEPRRTNQTYCSRDCQKKASRNTSQGDRSAEYRAMSDAHYSRAEDLFHMVYSAPPCERLGVMKDILEHVPHDAGLRRILCDPQLLRDVPRADGRKNIAKAANSYTQMFFGVSIKTYIREVQSGKDVEGVEVNRQVNCGPVPRIGRRLTRANVHCWHKPVQSNAAASVADYQHALQEHLLRLQHLL